MVRRLPGHFGLGTNKALYHKWWNGAWGPSQSDWENLRGTFTVNQRQCPGAAITFIFWELIMKYFINGGTVILEEDGKV
ncbi:hypothetical protein PAAG_12647 [Paracoccidioides lutzii Pb01]|uniref:Uncharacterized protein n=1 Tax=Paracoccidioides lutzii (strain ATCC MYA-826 / Pb01) TaxID=502779 RepID=A0A0A2UYR2_PARBA|nr:hypothetical protein PAAG_12647 [Paracoccidioides lutzii Pb01]KGQ00691.1 hypothetical protein PAAG_12647 [Paracoccidioides lutzii Pb01]